MIKIYDDAESFKADADNLAASGWKVACLTSHWRRPGIARYIFLGPILAFLIPPKAVIVVVYEKSGS